MINELLITEQSILLMLTMIPQKLNYCFLNSYRHEITELDTDINMQSISSDGGLVKSVIVQVGL